MFMILLKKNAPILAFVLVLALCGLWAVLSYESPKDDDAVKAALASRKAVLDKLNKGDVTPEYPNSTEKQNEIKYIESVIRERGGR